MSNDFQAISVVANPEQACDELRLPYRVPAV